MSAREIAELIGLDLAGKDTKEAVVEPPPVLSPGPQAIATSMKTSRRVLMPVDAGVLRAHAAVPAQAPSSFRIETLEHLRRYLVEDFQRELEAIDDLGSNEGRFQHKIVAALESRISHEPFYIDERQHLSDLDQFPDVMIQHARGNTAFELKRAGNVKALLKDADKLKGYLRAKRIKVTFGVLIYSSPFAVPSELARAMRSDQLHLVRVHPSRNR